MTAGQRRASPGTGTDARVQLLEAAAKIVATGGVEAATSRAITDAAGQNLGSITYYFGSKDSLISESLAMTARMLMEPVVAELTDQVASPAQRLLKAVQMLNRILEDQRDRLPGYIHGLAVSTHDETVGSEIRALHRDLTKVLEDEMTTQQNAGLIPDWVIPNAMAQLIVALVDGMSVAVAIDPIETDPTNVSSQFAMLLLAVRPSVDEP